MARGNAKVFVLARVLLLLIVVPLAFVSPIQAQNASSHEHRDITGDWQGTLALRGRNFRIVLKIAKADNGSLTALNYVIDQGPTPMATSAVSLRGNAFQYAIPALHGNYEGQLSADGNSIAGTWTQAKATPLLFTRATKETAWEIPAPPPPPKAMAADADPSFEVVTIKPSDPDKPGKFFRVVGRSYVTHGTSLVDLIKVCYGVNAAQIAGGPAWINDDKFDVMMVHDGVGEPNARQWLQIMQKLLADRFKLTLHHEKQPRVVYALSIAKSGPKNFTKSQSTSLFPSLELRPGPEGVLVPAKNATIAQFAQMMQQAVLDKPVADQTGLTDRFDFQLTFTPDDSQFDGHPPSLPPQTSATDSAPGLADALQQQLGLKLGVEKIPIDVLVIDGAEKPSAN